MKDLGHGRVLVPAGTYVLGDPCYVVPDELWIPLLESNNYFGNPVGRVTHGGVEYTVMGFHTAYGDGEYMDQAGFVYSVDSGSIGLVPIELADDPSDDLSQVVTFVEPAYCTTDGGTLVFGSYSIETAPEYEDEDEDEDVPDYWEDDDE